jgi:hypothetical protein
MLSLFFGDIIYFCSIRENKFLMALMIHPSVASKTIHTPTQSKVEEPSPPLPLSDSTLHHIKQGINTDSSSPFSNWSHRKSFTFKMFFDCPGGLVDLF